MDIPIYWHKKIPMFTEQEDALWRMTFGEDLVDDFVKVSPEKFKKMYGINQRYLYRGDFTEPADMIDYTDADCYIADDGLSGFCISPDGWLKCLFSNSGKGDFLKRAAPTIKDKARALVCIISDATNDKLVKLYEKELGFHVTALTVNDSAKMASCYGMEFVDSFREQWGEPRHVFMTKDDYNCNEPIPQMLNYFEAEEYVHNIMEGKMVYFEQKRHETGTAKQIWKSELPAHFAQTASSTETTT